MARKLSLFLLLSLFSGRAAGGESPGIQVLFPVDGLVLTPRCDTSPAPGLQVWLLGLAPAGFEVWVDGHQARPMGDDLPSSLPFTYQAEGQYARLGYPLGERFVDLTRHTPFFCPLEVREPLADVEIVAHSDEEVLVETAAFYFRPEPVPTFTVTIDDAADLFAQLARQANRYTSIFDHPILEFLRGLHQRYGAVFSCYLFEQGTLYPDFDLSQMPDRFRAEWTQNSSWLRLGFHGRSMSPAEPYAQATAPQALGDFNAIRNQVVRFAGPQVWDLFLRSHYWSGSRQSCQAWRRAGARGLYGAVAGHRNYYLTAAQSSVVQQCDYWWDQVEDLLFVQTDIWVEQDFRAPGSLSKTASTRVTAKLDSLFRQPWASQNAQIFTHESLLFPHAASWGVRERLEESISWLVSRGYVGRFDSDDPFLDSVLPPPYAVHLAPDALFLSWSPPQREGLYRYQIYRKDLSNPLGPWAKVGEETQWRFADSWQAGLYAYRVFAVDAAGRRSAGSQPIELEILPSPDFNGNGVIDIEDFFALVQNLGKRRGEPDVDLVYDLNGDGVVDWADLAELKQGFGRAPRVGRRVRAK